MSEINERMAKVEQRLDDFNGKVKYLEDKKLSKHEFNGFQQLVEAMKSTLLSSIKGLHDTSNQLKKTTNENTKAINNLQNTFSSIEKYMPLFLRTIRWACGIIISLLGVIIGIYGKQLGLW